MHVYHDSQGNVDFLQYGQWCVIACQTIGLYSFEAYMAAAEFLYAASNTLATNCLQVTSQMWSGIGRSYRHMISLHFLSSRKACSKQSRIHCQLTFQVWSVSSTTRMHEKVTKGLQKVISGCISCVFWLSCSREVLSAAQYEAGSCHGQPQSLRSIAENHP